MPFAYSSLLCQISSDSLLNVNYSSLIHVSTISPFICAGVLILSAFTLIYTDHSLFSLTINKNYRDFSGFFMRPSVILSNSSFQNIDLLDTGGTFLHSGWMDEERVKCCSFRNISSSSTAKIKSCYLSGSIKSFMEDSLVNDCDEAIGGTIANLISTDVCEFLCQNCSFIVSTRSIHYTSSKMNGNYSNTTYSSQTSLGKSSHSFTNCTFKNCSASGKTNNYSGNGGAICYYQNQKTSYSITVTSCSFSDCSAVGWGGAILIKYAASCIVNTCSFSNCSSTGKNKGGAVDMEHLSTCEAVKNSNVTSCTAGSAGGVQIYSCVLGNNCEGGVNYGIISDCLFSGCNTTNETTDGEGGGTYLAVYSTYSFRSCLFSQCKSSGTRRLAPLELYLNVGLSSVL